MLSAESRRCHRLFFLCVCCWLTHASGTPLHRHGDTIDMAQEDIFYHWSWRNCKSINDGGCLGKHGTGRTDHETGVCEWAECGESLEWNRHQRRLKVPLLGAGQICLNDVRLNRFARLLYRSLSNFLNLGAQQGKHVFNGSAHVEFSSLCMLFIVACLTNA
jgi:hypothetical protein